MERETRGALREKGKVLVQSIFATGLPSNLTLICSLWHAYVGPSLTTTWDAVSSLVFFTNSLIAPKHVNKKMDLISCSHTSIWVQ